MGRAVEEEKEASVAAWRDEESDEAGTHSAQAQLQPRVQSRNTTPWRRSSLRKRKEGKQSESTPILLNASHRDCQKNERRGLTRVSTASEQQQRQLEALDEPHTLGVSLHRQVEASELVAAQRVGSALQDDGVGLIPLDNSLDDGLEDGGVGGVGDTVVEGYVDGVSA